MKTTEDRFWEKVEKAGPDECWGWTAATYHNGYGSFWNGQRTMRAHRFAYERLVGPIPEGLQIDHLCRNPACVNPGHLEPVTRRENILRGEGITAQQARKTHCVHGHPFDEENTYVHPRGRTCRACNRAIWHRRSKGEK